MKRKLLFFAAFAAASLFQRAVAQNTSPYWSLSGNSNATTSSKLGTTNSVPLRLVTKNVERLRIDSLGRVGIGLTSLKSKLSVLNSSNLPASPWLPSSTTPLFLGLSDGGSGSGDFILATASASAGVRPVLISRRSRGTLSAPALVNNGDLLASLLASGYDGKSFQNAAGFDFAVDGATAAGMVPTRISFYTGSSAANRTERLRIGSNGNINIGGPTLYPSTARLQIKTDLEYNRAGGIYIESINEEFRNGIGIGVESRGAIGVKGIGSTGIYGIGDADGSGGTGVYGIGTANSGIGVHGDNPDGTGVYATGGRGLYVEGTDEDAEAIRANGSWFGMKISSQIYAIQAYASGSDGYGGYFSSAGSALYARAGSEPDSYAGVFAGNVYATGTFQSSDKNLKQNIKEFKSALDLINKLKPRNYEFKTEGKLAALRLPAGTHYGLIAQDVEEVLPGLVKDVRQELTLPKAEDFKKLEPGKKPATAEKPQRETMTIKAVNYTELIPIVIKGMQELNAKTDEIDELKKEVAELRQLVLELKSGPANTVTLLNASLEQNTPNPVNGTTSIRYNVPQTSTSARLTITNTKGQVVKTVTLGNRGAGQVNINTAALAAGTYNYTLYVDGTPTDTKRLIIIR